MSTATAQAAPAPAAGGKKKLLVIVIAAVLVLVLGGGAAAFLLMKKQPAEGEEEGNAPPVASAAAAKRAPGVPPTFVPLDLFTVNLADRDSERYAQVGITLEISDPKLGDEIKAYMPAIRNRVLMTIADRTAAQLITREGKEELAQRVRRETSIALGFDVPDEDEEEEAAAEGKQKKRRRAAAPPLPVDAVHFSSFIVQ
jgi:flagellar FliL protein